MNSPLYPDGIMSPLWIQKIKSNPGVVLGVYDLIFTKSKQDPLGVSTSESYRDNDSKLCALLNEKRKGLPPMSERGRKFIPVFQLLEYNQELSPVLEERIAFIKKTCNAEKIFTIDISSINDEEELKKFNKA